MITKRIPRSDYEIKQVEGLENLTWDQARIVRELLEEQAKQVLLEGLEFDTLDQSVEDAVEALDRVKTIIKLTLKDPLWQKR